MTEAVQCNCGHMPVVKVDQGRVIPFLIKTKYWLKCPYCGQRTIGIYSNLVDAIEGWNRLIKQLQ